MTTAGRACVIFVTLLVVVAATPYALLRGAITEAFDVWEVFFKWAWRYK